MIIFFFIPWCSTVYLLKDFAPLTIFSLVHFYFLLNFFPTQKTNSKHLSAKILTMQPCTFVFPKPPHKVHMHCIISLSPTFSTLITVMKVLLLNSTAEIFFSKYSYIRLAHFIHYHSSSLQKLILFTNSS